MADVAVSERASARRPATRPPALPGGIRGDCLVIAASWWPSGSLRLGTPLAGSEDAPSCCGQVDKQRVPFGSPAWSSLMTRSGASCACTASALAINRVYQVLLSARRRSRRLFTVGEDGAGSPAVHDTLEGADAVLITREAAGGARAPSEDPILRVSL